MRIASAGIQHETNTFANTPTTLADFERDSECGPDFAGDRIRQRYASTNTIHGGYLQGASECDVELSPLLCARAQPGGLVDRDGFERLVGLLTHRLQADLPLDGVLLDLHGAMVTDDHQDAEGEIISRVRDILGNDVPVVVTLDLHANITSRMAAAADLLIGFETYPHVDMRDRGIEAVRLLVQIVRGEVRPIQAFKQLPLVTLPPKQCTLREPMQSLMNQVARLKSTSDALTATISMGFPFADIHDAGVSVLVATDNDAIAADRHADELADRVWALRDALQPELTSIDDAIEFANGLPSAAGPVIFADGSDNPGGGAPCDGTVALRALIDAEFQDAVVGILCDPETVAQAHNAGVGTLIDARIGAKTDDRHGTPVATRAHVRTLSDGRFVHQGPMRNGLPGDFGRMATLEIGDVRVVVSERRTQLLDAEMLRIVGITPERCRLLVVKSAVHFRADFEAMASAIFDADTPGIHRPDFECFEYRKLRRPVYPLDRNVTRSPEST